MFNKYIVHNIFLALANMSGSKNDVITLFVHEVEASVDGPLLLFSYNFLFNCFFTLQFVQFFFLEHHKLYELF